MPSSHTARVATSWPYPTAKLNVIWKLRMSARLKYETLSMLCVGSYLLLSFLLAFRFSVLHFTWVLFLIKYRLFYFFFPPFSPCICPFLLSTLLLRAIITSFRSREQAKRATAIFVCVTPALCSISSLRLFISSQIQCYPSSICLPLFFPSNSLTGHQ